METETDELDYAILAELDLNCRRSNVELSKVLGRSRQTVDYRIERLEQRGILLNYHCTVSFSRIGYRFYKVFLRLRNLPERKKDFRELLYRLGNVYWIGVCSGSWDIMLGVFYRDEYELAAMSNEIVSTFDDLVVERHGQVMVGIEQYPKMYFTKKIYPSRQLLGPLQHQELDPHDYSLLAELIHNARVPLSQLSDTLGLSIAAVQRRMKRLEESGIIVQYRIGVDLNKLGLQLYKVIFDLWSYSDEEHKKFVAYISTRPELQFFVRNIWSVELEVIVPSYQAILDFIFDITSRFPRLSAGIDTLLLESDEWTSALTYTIQRKGLQSVSGNAEAAR